MTQGHTVDTSVGINVKVNVFLCILDESDVKPTIVRQ